MSSESRGPRLCRPGRRSIRARGGFSLIELLVVVAILMVVAAVSVPNIMQAIAQVRLRSAANTVAGMLQQGRMRAIRDNGGSNGYYRVIADPVGSTDSDIVCIDLNNNGTCTGSTDTGTGAGANQEPQARLGGTNRLTTSAPPYSVQTAAGFNASGANLNVVEQDKNLQVYFNSRGLPCAISGSRCVSNASGNGNPYAYIYYITDGRPIYGWAAVTVSVGGRIRVWMYAGNNAWDQ